MVEPDGLSQSGDRGDGGSLKPPGAELGLPAFVPATLHRQLLVDSVIWWIFTFALLAALGLSLAVVDQQESFGMLVCFVLFGGAWVLFNLTNARVAQQLPQITQLVESGGREAESLIRNVTLRRPLHRGVRLLVYHRMAMLRYRQRRFAEVVVICRSVLSCTLGPARQVKAYLLILMAEAGLECRDWYGAWAALVELHRCRLSLAEALRLLALQTRYQVQFGDDHPALYGIEHKMLMADLMSAEQCGATNAFLSIAAWRLNQPDLSRRLWERAHLLCTPRQLEEVKSAVMATHQGQNISGSSTITASSPGIDCPV